MGTGATNLRPSHGSSEQLLGDYQQLGVGWVRQMFDVNVDLSATWQSQLTWHGLDSAPAANLYAVEAADGLRWTCPPANVSHVKIDYPEAGCDTTFASPIADWAQLLSTACDLSANTGLFTMAPFLAFQAAAAAKGLTPIPELFAGHTVEDEYFEEGSRTVCSGAPPELEVDDCSDDKDPNGFPWAFVLEAAADQVPANTPLTGAFWVGNADRWVDGLVQNEDVLLLAYLDLVFQNPSDWGAGGKFPYVQIANEVVRNEAIDCTRRGRHIGWLLIRTVDWIHRKTEETQPGTRPAVLFPGISSFNDSAPYEEGAYTDRVYQALDETFFHAVRAALVAQQGGDRYPHSPSRFALALGEDVWYGWESFFIFYTFWVVPALGEALDGGPVPSWVPDWFDLSAYTEEDLAAAPGAARDLEYGNGLHRLALQIWSVAQGLRAPFDVMDFHWYNSGGCLGQFKYLTEVKAYVERIRQVMSDWFMGGEDLPIWCTETGISASQTPTKYNQVKLKDLTTVPACYGALGFEGDDPAADVRAPTEAESGEERASDCNQCATAETADFEFRIRPTVVAAAWQQQRRDTVADVADLPEGTHPDEVVCGKPWEWPSWVFTSEREQAIQVWTRLSFLFGLGLEKVFWDSPNPAALVDGHPSGLFSYGLTDDATVDVDRSAGGCGLAEGTLPDFDTRSKKPGFCALGRWNLILDRFQAARVILDGSDGFYAVAFRREDTPAWEPEYPYAIVAWADTQTYTGFPAHPTSMDLPVATSRTIHVGFLGSVDILEVPTLPREAGAADPSFTTGKPCGDDSDPATGYDGTRHMAFDDGTPVDTSLVPLGVWPWRFASLTIQVDEDGTRAEHRARAPTLWLVKQPAAVYESDPALAGTVLFQLASLDGG